jgi:serpin B
MKFLLLPLAFFLAAAPSLAQPVDPVAASAINALGIDLLHQTASPNANALLSPYSIQMALAMTCAGADGQTRAEMGRVLHYPTDQTQVDRAFSALQENLNGLMQRQAAEAESLKPSGVTLEPLTLTTVNRLYGQQSYEFRPAYLNLLNETFQAPLERWDFVHDADGAITHINDWVARQTHDRIQNIIPPGGVDNQTRLVLVNAIYLKAPWQTKFDKSATQSLPFHLPDGSSASVPTMYQEVSLGYAHPNGYQAVVLPYIGGDLQFVIFLPDDPHGLPALESRLTPQMLSDCARLPNPDLKLFLPKFKLAPPTLSLSQALQSLGLKQAFDIPVGSANFDRMAPRRPNDYLYISEVFHKTFLNLDESETEAAAATVVSMDFGAAAPMTPPPPPIEVHVDHPFLFAIQHQASGACLFLGHVTDPR